MAAAVRMFVCLLVCNAVRMDDVIKDADDTSKHGVTLVPKEDMAEILRALLLPSPDKEGHSGDNPGQMKRVDGPLLHTFLGKRPWPAAPLLHSIPGKREKEILLPKRYSFTPLLHQMPGKKSLDHNDLMSDKMPEKKADFSATGPLLHILQGKRFYDGSQQILSKRPSGYTGPLLHTMPGKKNENVPLLHGVYGKRDGELEHLLTSYRFTPDVNDLHEEDHILKDSSSEGPRKQNSPAKKDITFNYGPWRHFQKAKIIGNDSSKKSEASQIESHDSENQIKKKSFRPLLHSIPGKKDATSDDLTDKRYMPGSPLLHSIPGKKNLGGPLLHNIPGKRDERSPQAQQDTNSDDATDDVMSRDAEGSPIKRSWSSGPLLHHIPGKRGDMGLDGTHTRLESGKRTKRSLNEDKRYSAGFLLHNMAGRRTPSDQGLGPGRWRHLDVFMGKRPAHRGRPMLHQLLGYIGKRSYNGPLLHQPGVGMFGKRERELTDSDILERGLSYEAPMLRTTGFLGEGEDVYDDLVPGSDSEVSRELSQTEETRKRNHLGPILHQLGSFGKRFYNGPLLHQLGSFGKRFYNGPLLHQLGSFGKRSYNGPLLHRNGWLGKRYSTPILHQFGSFGKRSSDDLDHVVAGAADDVDDNGETPMEDDFLDYQNGDGYGNDVFPGSEIPDKKDQYTPFLHSPLGKKSIWGTPLLHRPGKRGTATAANNPLDEKRMSEETAE